MVTGIDSLARLSQRPSSLYDLWKEYENGVGGMKPAKKFTAAERGQKCVRFKFSLRKVFWDVVVKMTSRGHTADVAIHQIYAAYGEALSVTAILRLMRTDKARGGHPQLRC